MKENDEKNTTKSKKKIIIPRRTPSIVIPERKPVYITADKTTCLYCGCFPKEDPYVKNKKLNPCQKSPLTLYEIAAKVVDSIPFPPAFSWSIWEVADWMSYTVGLPQYTECIILNGIDGLRLLMLEDPSKLPEMNIHDFHDILTITSHVRQVYTTEWIRFSRSIGLPPRKPLTHCTWFKSRTGPSWGIRRNWTRCDVLRWMKIIMPEPVYLDHWDLVWYRKPDFPKVKFARVHGVHTRSHIPRYDMEKDVCYEYLVPRKFRIMPHLTESQQVIWMEKRREERAEREKRRIKIVEPRVYKTNLFPKKINLAGLKGEEFILARRKMPKVKFFP